MNKTVELKDEEFEKVSGGAKPESQRNNGPIKKGWVCKNCGNIQETWDDYGGITLAACRSPYCDQCGATDSFEERDVDLS